MLFLNSLLAWARGFEPPTFWSVAKRSIQLSYAHKTVSFYNKINYIPTCTVCQLKIKISTGISLAKAP